MRGGGLATNSSKLVLSKDAKKTSASFIHYFSWKEIEQYFSFFLELFGVLVCCFLNLFCANLLSFIRIGSML